jgi:transposase
LISERYLNQQGDGSMKEISVLGIDLAKNVFQLIGLDKHHKVVMKKRVNRKKLEEYTAKLPRCTILMEACGGSNHWGRSFVAMGHDAKLISPQHVTPYVANHKNDYKDTEAILESGTRPRTKFVSIKTIEQQDMQSILRVRERHVGNRVSLSNQIRGLLLEYGIDIPQGFSRLKEKIPQLLEPENEALTAQMKEVLADSYEEFKEISERISAYDKRLENISNRHESCRLLRSIPGVGPVTAVALYAAVGNGCQFKNGREMAAHIGLVPRQHSSGEKRVLLGITKKGHADLKRVLIHGARSVVRFASKKTDWRSEWITKLSQKKPTNVVVTAVANRTARIAWAVLQSCKPYQANNSELTEGGVCYPQSSHALHNIEGLRA